MSCKVVKANAVKSATFHSPCHLLLRLDTTPFFLLYSSIVWSYFAKNEEWGDIPLFVAPIFVFLHILLELSCYWSVNIRTLVSFSKKKRPQDATFVKIIPIANKGNSSIVPIEQKHDGKTNIYYINWRKRVFIWSEEENQFRKINYPTNNKFSDYLNWGGYSSMSDIENAIFSWDKNKFDIPIPNFMDLYKEQALSPFFVFQIFCVLLWFLDEYWYYALFTFIMLFIFEATITQSRLRNLICLRNMIQPSQDILVFRERKWMKIDSYELLPGDICSVVRKNADTLLPCDILLLKGSCVVNEAMLTGESTPQLKESIAHTVFEDSRKLHLQNDSIHILYGGTNVINHIVDADADSDINLEISKSVQKNKSGLPSPTDKGCIGYVLRTGFETNQGKLIRTILYSTDRVTANNLESLLFIVFLLIFAITASVYVLMDGWMDPNRSRYKLILKCILIITSVVPPELPMELSLAVNTSLVALSKLGIYCTEPFRIPFAGKTNICCFDKTGTLTSDELILKGIAGLDSSSELFNERNQEKSKSKKSNINNNIRNVDDGGEKRCNTIDTLFDSYSQLPNLVHYNIAGCHSLIYVNDKLIGDPMEVASLSALKWNVSKGDVCTRKSGNMKVQILSRFHFSSNLKRMSTVISTGAGEKSDYMVVAKGAPEVLVNYMSHYPSNYHEIYRYFSREGYRAVALAHKFLPNIHKQAVIRLTREEAECDLVFTGFLVFECPIKNESFSTIQSLTSSSHRTVMITGDNLLTGAKVANILKMNQKPTLILEKQSKMKNKCGDLNHNEDHEGEYRWVSTNEDTSFAIDDIKSIRNHFDLCVSGESMKELKQRNLFKSLLSSIVVFARVSPEEKEEIIVTFKSMGNSVLMCGDGTNDVGALKQAHIGVALLNTAPSNNNNNNNNNNASHHLTTPQRSQTLNDKPAIVEVQSTINNRRKNQSQQSQHQQTQQQQQQQQQQQHPHGAPVRRKRPIGPPTIFDDNEMATVKLGDASIAAPFTTKGFTIRPIVDIIRQGRCTLVTTLQMYMILALNCLISAYSLSVLSLSGFKMGDTQATMIGLLITFCFLFISRSKPLDQLSSKRPASSLFTINFFVTLLGQFAIHLYSLILVHSLAVENTPPSDEVIDIDAPFTPSIVNSAVFLISSSMQVATFVVNYRGHPFMQSIPENKPLLYSLAAVAGITFLAAAQVLPEFTELLELVEFTPEFRSKLLLIMIFDFIVAFIWDRVSGFIFC